MKKFTLLLFFFCVSISLLAQKPVPVGKGSYAEFTPLYKSRTDEHGGDQSRFMETRKLYVTEKNAGKAIPTNDWWTDIITKQYSGNLWSYPQVVKAEEYGIFVAFPKEWEATGHELKWQSQIEILGKKFKPASADLNDWHDWGFDFLMKDAEKEMLVTLAHGIPFTWVETKNIDIQLRAKNAVYYSKNGILQFPYTGSEIILEIGNDAYGVYVPDGTVFTEKNGLIELSFTGNQHYLSVGVLPTKDALMPYAEYAYTIPRNTTVSWDYKETSGKVTTKWDIDTENLKSASQKNVLQGFIPHHYKNSEFDFSFLPYQYQTPRGTMKMSTGNSFTISYDFNGMLPYFALPEENEALKNPYQKERMKQLIADYADRGGFGADTYWGGKGLIQMGLYMTFAYETGEMELFEKCKNRLKAALVNWLTYTPGENNFFFARYNRWGALVGYDTSYDSDTFNDHHFHYGYFTYAASLLALFDDDFKDNYGEMITLIAKDYANWDRNDTQFPFFRTFDPWAGHSYAGGMGNNGNGQESSSEAMQSWGGMYLLGMATGNKAMRNAGIFGWTLEARGIAEYWYDRDKENIDYTKYTRPYNSNLTSQGIGWWTWFSGDPVWMHSIQWMPISPCLKYLYEDLDFARWDYTTMWNSKEVGDWTTQQGLPSSLSYESGLGNVVLSYLQIFDPDSAIAVYDRMWDANMPIAKNPDTGGISYYISHSHRTYGDICWDIHADIPSASTYKHPQTNKLTFVVYNPESTEKTIRFFQNGTQIKQIKVPARRMTVYSDNPVLSSIEIKAPQTKVVEPANTLQLEAVLYDQYGAEISGNVSWTINQGGTLSPSGLFTAGSTKGITATITATSGAFSDDIELKINDKPVLTSAQILPQQAYLESGKILHYSLEMKDQYDEDFYTAVNWQIKKNAEVLKTDSIFDIEAIGIYTITASVGEQNFSTELFLSPAFSNIALNKTATALSQENGGTFANNATDGDLNTRWGSQHSDPQWIYVDLGAVSYVSYARLVWEAAYSSLYELQISDNKQSWETIETVHGLGGTEIMEINRETRYVRMYGKERATIYGHSLYEFEIYGVPPMGASPQLFGIDLQPHFDQIKENETINLKATGYDQFGDLMTISPQFSIVSGEGTITPEGAFTPTKYGTAVVEAKVNSLTAKATFIVEESIKLKKISISPKNTQLIKAESISFSTTSEDQFGAPYPAEDITYTLIGEGGELSGNTFTANAVGEYKIIVGVGEVKDTAFVKVAELTDVNLALHKAIFASSYENGATLPNFINDGDYNTRWGSAFSEPEFIQVDLSENYVINKINIFWDNVYATSYRVDVSLDEDEWTTIYTDQSGNGGLDNLNFDEIACRYVRLHCLARSSQYGSSVFELEVYGTNFWRDPEAVRIEMNQSPITAYIGENLELSPILYDQYGLIFEAENAFVFSVNGGGTIDDNTFIPTETGNYILTVQYAHLSKNFQLRVLANKKITHLEISPAYALIKVNENLLLTAKAFDQYGNEMDFSPEWKVSGGNLSNGVFSSSSADTHTITVSYNNLSSSATIQVIEAPTVNIALKKPATSSSGTASAAVDGNMGSRWESAHQDGPEWLMIDLQDAYLLTDAEIVWETASARNYEIQVSKDGENWTRIYDAKGLSGARTDTWRISGIGQYVRVWCTARASQWGYSIFEFRLYGRKMEAGEAYSIEFVDPTTVLDLDQEVHCQAKVYDKNGAEIQNPELIWSVEGVGTIDSDGKFISLFSGLSRVNLACQMAETSLSITVNNSTSTETVIEEPLNAWIYHQTLYVKGENIEELSLYNIQGGLIFKTKLDQVQYYEQNLPFYRGILILKIKTNSSFHTIKLVQ